MDEEERAHNESLLQIYTGHLRQLELMAAKYGDLAVPPHVALEIAEYRRKISELEGRLRPPSSQRTEGPRHNLPPRDYERFVGRQQELAEVRRLLGLRSRIFIVTIDGIGGIGKSSFALETAYVFVEQYAELPEDERFEAIVWVSAKRTYLTASGIHERHQVFHTLEDVFAAIARVLDYPAITRARADEQRAIVEQALREQRTLLILDNLETVDDDDLLYFLNELPDPTKALVTTRHRIDVARPIRLSGMAHHDALDLIVQEAARKDVALSQEEQAELWRRTGGVPLAIVWSIGLMGLGGSVESVLRRLGSGQSDIARFCFAESVAQVRGRDSEKLLVALSLFATDASREALGLVAGLGEDEFGRDVGLEELLRLSLVNKDGHRYSLLPLTRTFVRDSGSREEAWIVDARQRMHQYYLEVSSRGDDWFFDWEWQAAIERDLPNIVAVIESVQASLSYQENVESQGRFLEPSSISLARQLVRYLRLIARVCRIRGYWSDCERLCEMAIEICKYLNDHNRIGWRYYDLSRISYYRGDLVLARQRSQKARSEWSRDQTDSHVHHADRVLGLIALREGNLVEARRLLTQSLDAYQAAGRSGAFSYYASAFGMLTEREGKLDEAMTWYQRSIDMYRQKNDLSNLALDLLNLGQVQQRVGQFEYAEEQYNESLKVAGECGRADVIARVQYDLAELELQRGRQQSAKEHAHQALELFRRVGMKIEQAETEALLAKLAEGSPKPTQDQ
jgi:tetratricopeptide (TPR) repeat protein